MGKVFRFDQNSMNLLRVLIEVDKVTQSKAANILGASVSAVERCCKRMQLKTSRTGPRGGAEHPNWIDGRTLDKHGYIEVYAPLHPLAKKQSGRVYEHRLVSEVDLGRYLTSVEVIDHIDNHPRHNWPDNLQVYACNADHLRATLTGREKCSPRSSIPGAYGCSQKIHQCPTQLETLGKCSLEIRQSLTYYIESHHPTTEHSSFSKKELLRQGAHRDPFGYKSTV